jgi:polar amino acid transport system permease protein
MAARFMPRSSGAASSRSTPGQPEAGLALGMTPFQSMRRIILPQALKRMIPPLMNQSIIQFKNTSLVSVLAVPDLLYQGQIAA